MRIALVTEQLGPIREPGHEQAEEPTAHVTREVVARLTDRGHDVVVFSSGSGPSTYRGARMFWASRMTPVSAVREAMALSRPDLCHLIDPHRLGLKAAEAAERLGVPTLVLDPRRWQPGVDLEVHHPGLRDGDLHQRWARAHCPDGGQLVVGHVGPLEGRSVLTRLVKVAQLPGVRLVALGDGPGSETLRRAGAEVIPHASGPGRARCLATFDVLLQPRKRQVYAPVVHQALASGVPVVAFDSGTAAAVVEHEHNGLLVATDRGGKALARMVALLAARPALRMDLAVRSRASVAGRTWEQAVTELLDHHYLEAVRPSPLDRGRLLERPARSLGADHRTGQP